ncbi:hypothetical protein BCU68_15500 [Vibrio sp. 10N.286.49.B3]|uniref:hypothetical protein n=1 Tax=Vibrio sp. 10N.286.49.B3 TaxID=1880855 RepID=UPI000C84A9E2|nr:hypothetical protein [Vibrio sp. 10N.286.49.B3]PMH41465.1 hypothetical protein BCU68_15500 [Vibrio sp. 10N.286.49.B3]
MLTSLERLSVYSVLCFMAFCRLVTMSPTDTSIIPVVAVGVTIMGIAVEVYRWKEDSSDETDEHNTHHH